jgi:hypothetical protein
MRYLGLTSKEVNDVLMNDISKKGRSVWRGWWTSAKELEPCHGGPMKT